MVCSAQLQTGAILTKCRVRYKERGLPQALALANDDVMNVNKVDHFNDRMSEHILFFSLLLMFSTVSIPRCRLILLM